MANKRQLTANEISVAGSMAKIQYYLNRKSDLNLSAQRLKVITKQFDLICELMHKKEKPVQIMAVLRELKALEIELTTALKESPLPPSEQKERSIGITLTKDSEAELDRIMAEIDNPMLTPEEEIDKSLREKKEAKIAGPPTAYSDLIITLRGYLEQIEMLKDEALAHIGQQLDHGEEPDRGNYQKLEQVWSQIGGDILWKLEHNLQRDKTDLLLRSQQQFEALIRGNELIVRSLSAVDHAEETSQSTLHPQHEKIDSTFVLRAFTDALREARFGEEKKKSSLNFGPKAKAQALERQLEKRVTASEMTTATRLKDIPVQKLAELKEKVESEIRDVDTWKEKNKTVLTEKMIAKSSSVVNNLRKFLEVIDKSLKIEIKGVRKKELAIGGYETALSSLVNLSKHGIKSEDFNYLRDQVAIIKEAVVTSTVQQPDAQGKVKKVEIKGDLKIVIEAIEELDKRIKKVESSLAIFKGYRKVQLNDQLKKMGKDPIKEAIGKVMENKNPEISSPTQPKKTTKN